MTTTYLLNNLSLPGRADDVDHMVVGPNGIFALETKNHRGRIFWREGQWYQAKVSRKGHPQPEEPIRDPSQQIKRNVDYLRSCINHTDPALSQPHTTMDRRRSGVHPSYSDAGSATAHPGYLAIPCVSCAGTASAYPGARTRAIPTPKAMSGASSACLRICERPAQLGLAERLSLSETPRLARLPVWRAPVKEIIVAGGHLLPVETLHRALQGESTDLFYPQHGVTQTVQ